MSSLIVLQECTVCFQRQEEVIFLSGAHIVNGTKNNYVYSEEASNLVLRGESSNVTIICLKGFSFGFASNMYTKVSNLTLVNCSMGSSQGITYKGYWYCCNLTFLFIGLEGSMILENIQTISNSRVDIAVYVKGDSLYTASVQLTFTNLKLSSGILITPYNMFIAHRVVIEITNSSFSDSYIKIVQGNNFLREFNVTIKNVSFESSSAWSSLIFRGIEWQCPFVVKIKGLDISRSMSPYIILANQTTVIFEGKNNFHQNHGVMYLVHSKWYFFNTTVQFINSTVGHGAPLIADDSVVVFKDTYIAFKTNFGLICGGILGTKKSVLFFRDNSTIHFERNEGNKGGALSLNKQSKMRFHSSTSNSAIKINFVSNEAQTGGAIFVKTKTTSTPLVVS